MLCNIKEKKTALKLVYLKAVSMCGRTLILLFYPNMSYGYFKDEGAMVYSGSDKHNIALSVKSEVNKRLSVAGKGLFHLLLKFAVLHHSSMCRLSMFLR